MNQRLSAAVINVLLATVSSVIAQDNAPDAIRFMRDKAFLFVNGNDVASTLNYKLKIAVPNRLITFCRDGEAGVCIPVRLTPHNHRVNDSCLMLDAKLVSHALTCVVVETNGKIAIEQCIGPGNLAAN